MMGRSKFAICFALFAGFVFSSSAQAQNIVLTTNDGFESPIALNGAMISNQWIPFVGSGAVSTTVDNTAPFAGFGHATLSIFATDNSFTGLFQQVDNIIAGASYDFSLQSRSLAPTLGATSAGFRIEWIDAAGNFVGGQFDNNLSINATDTYGLFSQSNIAPVGAVSLRAVVFLDSFGPGDGPNDNTATLFIDNASVIGPDPSVSVPEPTSLALLGLAATGMIVRRRRC